MTFICPGETTWMTPPYEHISLELLSSAGALPSISLGQPGTHGAAVAGMQGMGVRTPSAAAVAAATMGLASDWHIPNGRMFTRGLLSRTFAAGVGPTTLLVGSTTSDDGATPKLHCSIAPMTTWAPMRAPRASWVPGWNV